MQLFKNVRWHQCLVHVAVVLYTLQFWHNHISMWMLWSQMGWWLVVATRIVVCKWSIICPSDWYGEIFKEQNVCSFSLCVLSVIDTHFSGCSLAVQVAWDWVRNLVSWECVCVYTFYTITIRCAAIYSLYCGISFAIQCSSWTGILLYIKRSCGGWDIVTASDVTLQEYNAGTWQRRVCVK